MPAIERILRIFPGLKAYFLSQEKCPKILRNFFNDPASELWLNFVHSQAAIFQTSIKVVEGGNVSAAEVQETIENLKTNLQMKKDDLFLLILYAQKLRS